LGGPKVSPSLPLGYKDPDLEVKASASEVLDLYPPPLRCARGIPMADRPRPEVPGGDGGGAGRLTAIWMRRS
jgi:hypothetical protein